MAGRKQHHVPQLLQRGFGDKSGKETQVFVFQKSGHVYQANTKDYGAQRDFYAVKDDSFVDDMITDYENDINYFILPLKAEDPIALADTETISGLIAHLETRTLFLRQEMAVLMGAVTSTISDLFSRPRNVEKILQVYLREHPNFLEEKLSELRIESKNLALAHDLVSSQMEDLIRGASVDLSAEFSKVWRTVEADLIDTIKSAHIDSLKKQNASQVRAKFYEDLNYRVHNEIDGSFILPDVMTVFVTSDGIKPFTSKNDIVESVIFPLSSSQILIGEKANKVTRPLKQVNRMLASAAFGSFVAKSDSPEFRSLVCRIGRNAELLSNAELNNTRREFISELIVGSKNK